MRILVLAHELGVGGSQRNAIDLAREFRGRGHQVMVAGPHGPLGTDIEDAGLAYAPLWVGRLRPSPRRMREVRQLIAQFQPDIVHAYEWPSALEASLALRGRSDVALVTTVLSMDVDAEVPRSVPLLVGTPQIRDAVIDGWRAPVGLCEPPVDLGHDRWDIERGQAFRLSAGIRTDAVLAVIVSRIARRMKYPGVEMAARAVAGLDPKQRVQLAVVGDGDAMGELRRLADELNRGRRDPAVIVLGEQVDPRGAYSAADIMLGMGGSALRSMAHERALIVLGEGGFARILDADSVDAFTYGGFYGIGSAAPDPTDALAGMIDELARAPRRRHALGQFGYTLVRDRYALSVVADAVEAMYGHAIARGATWVLREQVRAHRAAALREVRLHLPKRNPTGAAQRRETQGAAS